MTNEEIIKELTKMLNNTIEANECGLSNNDFKDDIELLKSALSLIKEQEEEIAKYEKMTYFDDEDYDYRPPLVFRLDQVFKKDSNYDDYEDFEYNDITDSVEIMQYTGLHDKDGKEIYEGDIVFIDAYTYEGPEFDGEYLVKYNELLGMWTLINLENYNKEKEEFITFEDLNGLYRLDMELLGNKYENKELLNETNR